MSKRAAPRFTAPKSNQAMAWSVSMISSSPWLQPSLQQRVAHGRRQNAVLRIGADRDGAVPLGELRAVGAVDQRNMGVGRRLPPEGVEELGLAKSVGEVVVAPDGVGDPHVVVVHHHREHVGWRAVGAQEYHVVESCVIYFDITLY